MRRIFSPLLLLLLAHSLLAMTINVPADHGTIQQAINASADGDIIVCQPGWYLELINYNGKDVTVTSNYMFSQDTLDIQNTVLYGGQMGSVVTFENQETRAAVLNGFTITFGRSAMGGGVCILGSSPTLSNLAIIQNTSTGSGGGVYINLLEDEEIYYSSPRIEHSTILNNEAGSHGAGVYCVDSPDLEVYCLVVQDNQFTSNDRYGAGIYCSGSQLEFVELVCKNNGHLSSGCRLGGGLYATGGSAVLTDCSFQENYSGYGGGGLLLLNTTATLVGTQVAGNWSGNGEYRGAGIAISSSNVTMDSCTVSENRSESRPGNPGGGVGINAGSVVTARDCDIINNTAIYGYYEYDDWHYYGSGGGLSVHQSSCTLQRSRISGNRAYLDGGGIYAENVSTITVEDCTLRSNVSTNAPGGAMDLTNCTTQLRRCTMTLNQGHHDGGCASVSGGQFRAENTIFGQNTATSGAGGALYCSAVNPVLVNCTLSGNISSSAGGGVYLRNNSNLGLVNSIVHSNLPQQIYMHASESPNSAKITYCDVEGGSGAIVTNSNGMVLWMGGNLNQDPLFEEGYVLNELSPCINAGTTYVNWFGEVIVDLQPGDYYGLAPDMGAVEYEVPGIYASTHGLDYGYTTLGSTTTLPFTLYNNSDEAITLSSVDFAGSGAYSCNLSAGTVLSASGSLAVDVYFAPTQMIAYVDTLSLGWDTHLLEVDLYGYADPTPAQVQNIGIEMINNNAHVSWDPVTTTINGDPLEPTGYVVYYSTLPYEVMSFYAFVTEPEVVHHRIGHFNDQKYYTVTAYKGDIEEITRVIDDHPHFRMGELDTLLREQAVIK